MRSTLRSFVRSFVQRDEWLKLDRTQMTILEALDLLNELVDESDPDVSAATLSSFPFPSPNVV